MVFRISFSVMRVFSFYYFYTFEIVLITFQMLSLFLGGPFVNFVVLFNFLNLMLNMKN